MLVLRDLETHQTSQTGLGRHFRLASIGRDTTGIAGQTGLTGFIGNTAGVASVGVHPTGGASGQTGLTGFRGAVLLEVVHEATRVSQPECQ